MLNLVHDLAQILDRLHSGAEASSLETSTLEFKQEGDSLKRTLEIVADAVVCLANSEGGQVVLGVADRPGVAGSILGVSSELSVDVVVLGITLFVTHLGLLFWELRSVSLTFAAPDGLSSGTEDRGPGRRLRCDP